jgi:hypothetical protein
MTWERLQGPPDRWGAGLVVRRQNDQWPTDVLMYDRVDSKGQWLFTCNLMLVQSSEADLRGGRFVNYARSQQAYLCGAERNVTSGEHLRVFMTEMISFCGEYTESLWSFHVIMNTLNHVRAEFSFADDTEAVVFALRWS